MANAAQLSTEETRSIAEHAVRKTARALWLTGLPTLFFINIAALAFIRNPEMRTAISSDAFELQFSRWLYYSYFSLSSILLYKVYDDYGPSFWNEKASFSHIWRSVSHS